MKEIDFRRAVLVKVPVHVHRQPMLASMMGTAGTPDTYLDYLSDLWVEWKVLSRDDHLPANIPASALPTALQKLWLNRRYAAGGNAIVIVGCKLRGRAHGFVLQTPEEWSGIIPLPEHYTKLLRTAAELAAYITTRIS